MSKETNQLFEKLQSKAISDLKKRYGDAVRNMDRDLGLSGTTSIVPVEIRADKVKKSDDGTTYAVDVSYRDFINLLVNSLVARRKDQETNKQVDGFISSVQNSHSLISELMEYQQ